MFLLICKAGMGLTKANQLMHRRKDTHTHNYVSLAPWQWTLKKATSWPPWKLRVLLRSTEKKLATQWHGNHELMSKCCHTLRGCQIFWSWPWDSKTCIKFDQSTIQQELLICLPMNWVKGQGGENLLSMQCLLSDSNMYRDLTETEWWFGKCTLNSAHTLKRRGDRTNRYQVLT